MRLPWPYRLWIGACALGLGVATLVRILYYEVVSLPAWLDDALRGLILLEFNATIPVLVLDVFVLPLVALVAFPLWLARPRWFFQRASGRWHARAWVLALVWLVIGANQGFFGINRLLSIACWLTLPLVVPTAAAARRAIAVGLATGVLVWLAGDRADAVAALAWGLFLATLAVLGSRRLAARDRVAVAVLVMPLFQVLPAALPWLWPLHGGRLLGEHMAYSFCEPPDRDQLFATVPVCRGGWGNVEACRRGFVSELDPKSLALVAEHDVLSDRFYGRLEQLLCLEGAVQIGMDKTIFEGRRYKEDVMEFDPDDPRRTRVHLLGESGGHRVIHDARRDALLYVGHPNAFRVDRATGAVERFELGDRLAAQPAVIGIAHPDRDSVYLVWDQYPIRQLDLATLETTAEIPHAAASEIQIDTERDRLYASGFWGVEVIDLETGRPLFRERLGMIGRKPTIDETHGLIYVPTTGEGKLHVFDRDTFEHLGQIPIGYGPRYPHVTRAGAWLLATNAWAHYAWDASGLARRFRE